MTWKPWRSFPVLLLLGCGEAATDPDPAALAHELSLSSRTLQMVSLAGTAEIDFGTPAGRSHLLAGWSSDEIYGDDGTTFVWGLGAESTLVFVAASARELTVTARAMPLRWDGAPEQTVTVELNGVEVDRLRLRSGWQGYRLTLPAADVRPGQNTLRLRYGYSRVPAELDPGAADVRPLAVAWDVLVLGRRGDAPSSPPERRGDDLFLPGGTQLGFFPILHPGSVLTLDGLRGPRSGRLEIYLQTDGDERPRRLARLAPRARPTTVELGLAETVLARLTLAAAGDGEMIVVTPRLRGPAPMTSPSAAAPRPPPPAGDALPRRPNVVIYLVDTLRADHLGCYGYPRPTSPRIDAFAADAVLFTRVFAQSSWTRSAVASLLTGLAPHAHGVHSREDSLAGEALTVAELLSVAGYRTAAVVTNGHVDQRFGLGQGFDEFTFLQPPLEQGHATAEAVNEAAFDWLERERPEPFLLYLHTLEPHAPYAPPESTARRLVPGIEPPRLDPEARKRFAGVLAERPAAIPRERERHLGSITWIRALSRGLLPVDDALVEDLTALYDAEVAAADHHFGVFLDRLRDLDLDRDSLIVFLSDHGEELYDHRGWSHGMTLYQEQLHVPLILRLPDAAATSGLRVDTLARQIDVLPTILDVLGLPIPASTQGASLLPAIEAAARETTLPRLGHAYLDLAGRRLASAIEGSHKVICADPQMLVCRLYDLEADPEERHDLAAERPVLTGYLRSWLRLYQNREDVLEAPAAEIDPELRERLRALGYL